MFFFLHAFDIFLLNKHQIVGGSFKNSWGYFFFLALGCAQAHLAHSIVLPMPDRIDRVNLMFFFFFTR